MRTVSFVENLEFDYQGNIFSKSMVVGDVDNDTGWELVVGNVHGEMLIFKGCSNKPWKKASELGMITCLEIGDVFNKGMNFLVCLSGEGWCNVFQIQPDTPGKDTDDSSDDIKLVQPVLKQHLAANNKSVIIADIDGDGLFEMVIAYSDRRVRSFRWTESDSLESSLGLKENVKGKFVMLEQWQLAGQIGSVTINKKKDGTIDLMVSQPGGTFVTLLGSHMQAKQSDIQENVVIGQGQGQTDVSETSSNQKCPSVIYHPLGSARARNHGVTTEVVANISRRKKGAETYVPNYCAICTLDGTITLVDVDGHILWSLYVDHQLFSLAKLDVTGDGTEEVIACSWDGHTYLANLNKDAVRFPFEENVAAFCAGYYAVEGKKNVPCLTYATFNNKIKVFYNIHLPQIGTTNLIETMEKKEEIEEVLGYFNCDSSNQDQLRELYHWCLYGYHPKPP